MGPSAHQPTLNASAGTANVGTSWPPRNGAGAVTVPTGATAAVTPIDGMSSSAGANAAVSTGSGLAGRGITVTGSWPEPVCPQADPAGAKAIVNAAIAPATARLLTSLHVRQGNIAGSTKPVGA